MKLRQNLVADRVAHLDRSALVIVSPETSLRETLERMKGERSGCALVCVNDKLLGIITERDILKRVWACGTRSDTRVESVMTPDPVTTHADESVGVLIRKMVDGGYRHLPVIDEQQRPVGVVSVKGLIHYLVQHFPDMVYNLPPDPKQVEQSREGA